MNSNSDIRRRSKNKFKFFYSPEYDRHHGAIVEQRDPGELQVGEEGTEEGKDLQIAEILKRAVVLRG